MIYGASDESGEDLMNLYIAYVEVDSFDHQACWRSFNLLCFRRRPTVRWSSVNDADKGLIDKANVE